VRCNIKAARRVGVNVTRVAYGLASVAGMLLIARLTIRILGTSAPFRFRP